MTVLQNVSPMRAARPNHTILILVTNIKYLVKNKNYEAFPEFNPRM